MFPVSVCTHKLRQTRERRHRVRTESWSLEKVLTFAQQFSRPGKSLENGDKIWKNVFSKLQQVLYKWNFCRFGQILFSIGCTFAAHYKKKLCSYVFLKSILITCVIILSLEKEIIVLGKKSGESLEFWNQKTVRTLKTSWRKGLNQNRPLCNLLNPKIKIWILICCPYSFPTEVVGRSWWNIRQIHLVWSCP